MVTSLVAVETDIELQHSGRNTLDLGVVLVQELLEGRHAQLIERTPALLALFCPKRFRSLAVNLNSSSVSMSLSVSATRLVLGGAGSRLVGRVSRCSLTSRDPKSDDGEAEEDDGVAVTART